MRDRLARTKTEATAWELIGRLKIACPFNTFAVVIRAPGAGFEVHHCEAMHPVDRKAAAEAVQSFKPSA